MTQQTEFQFSAALERSDNKLWASHVCVPKRIAARFTNVTERRIVCSLNGCPPYQTAILPYKSGVWVIRVNKASMKKLGLTYDEEVSVQIGEDRSEYKLPMPEELEELLAQDEDGARFFHALTPGKRRTLLFIVNGVKSPEKRIIRALAIVQHLKANKGRIDYKKLNEDMTRRR